MKPHLLVLILLSSLAAVSCGLKGDLVLPEQAQPSEKQKKAN